MTPGEQDERIIKYLLGEAPETERLLMEEQYLASEDTFRQFQEVEAELYDAYARGSLSPERRRRFERRLLTSADQLRRLEFSRALIRTQSSSRPQSVWFHSRRLALAALGAAAIAILATAVWWTAWQRPRSQAAKQGTEPPSLSRSHRIVAFALVPGSTRAAGEEPIFVVPDGADVIRFTAPIDRPVYRSYHAIVRTPEGVEVWRKNDLQPQPGAAMPVVLDIPASSLVSAHYALTVSGDKADGSSEDVADYSFRIRKP